MFDRPVRRRLRAPVQVAAVLALGWGAAASYTVQPGDTLSGIAARHGMSTAELATANGITDPNHIVAGRTLRVGPSAGGGGASGAVHEVRLGENLAGIAARYGVSMRALADANGLANPNLIVAGRSLRIPAAGAGGGTASPPQSAGAQAVHTVRAGETLSGIAVRYRVSMSALLAANDLADANLVISGQRLVVPGAGGGTATTSAAPAASLPRAQVGVLLEQTARRYGWNPAFVKAVAWQESGWNQSVRSRANAIGIMQVMPSTGSFVSAFLVRRPLDLHDPADNVEAGVAFLDYLHRLTGGNVEQLLAGYYQGLASVRRNGMYEDTRRYIANVLALRERFR